jgi:hypothetical protein
VCVPATLEEIRDGVDESKDVLIHCELHVGGSSKSMGQCDAGAIAAAVPLPENSVDNRVRNV